MTKDDWLDADNAALFTDFYQLTMLQAYFREEMREDAVFDLFVRRLGRRNYLVACGLDTVLRYLENLHFTEQAVDFVGSQGSFDQAFLDYLDRFRFTGDVYAVAEGTPVFGDEPIIEVVAPIGEAQLVETFLLNQITFQTNAATKASRVRRAAGERLVSDFGMRRMHGGDAALKAARAFYVAGVDATSNVLAGQLYGIPMIGTMAHSYVEAHDQEKGAFEAFAGIFPGSTLLVDTYDTLEGIRAVVDLAASEADTFSVGGVRLDSGDLAHLSVEARRMLDEHGLEHVKIVASGSLDEHIIADLIEGGAPIDAFGVGTKMGTISDMPYLDSAYKLSGYAGTPRMKLSSEKSNLPGKKQVFRTIRGGVADGDVIAEAEEEIEGLPLLQQVMRNGRRLPAGTRTLEEIREHARSALAVLPDDLRGLTAREPPYSVELSARLRRTREETRRRLEAGPAGIGRH